MSCVPHATPRLLIVPGLNDSGPGHWQTWLEQQHRGARRVQQRDWQRPDLDAWADAIGATLAAAPRSTPWIAVAHSFGCLALARWLRLGGRGVQAAVLVAPADPVKFGVAQRLPAEPLPIRSVLAASRTDPWMHYGAAEGWAHAWGSQLVDLGDAGHVNVASGHGPWPFARQLVKRQMQRLAQDRRLHSQPADDRHRASDDDDDERDYLAADELAAALAGPERVAQPVARARRAALP